jgi:predicted O-linked N-acetylglucosamine transferase (SPINDLY family)
LIALQKGNYSDAANLIEKAIKINRNIPAFYCNLGNAYQGLGKFDSASSAFVEAVRLDPQFQAAHSNLGNALLDQGKAEKAVNSYSIALSLRPDFAEAHCNLGSALQALGKLDEAAACYRKALSLKPDYTEARSKLGNSLRADEATACFRQALSLEPTHFEWQLRILSRLAPSLADSRSQISTLRSRLADETERLSALDGAVHKLEIAAFSLPSLAYHGVDDKLLMERVAKLVRSKAPALNKSSLQRPTPISDDGRIHVGFLSSLLYYNTMGKLTQGYIRNLDRSRFHVTVIHAPGGKNDEIHNAINGMADAVVRLPSSPESARQLVAGLALDVLHYPDIGMLPYTYFLAYNRLAPVQTVSWGHPVTTGLDSIDYFLSFGAAEPADAETHYTETLVRLNRAPAYYEPFALPAQIESRAALGLPDSGRLYGCPQTLIKFHPDFDVVLADIIARDPQGWIITIGDHAGQLREQLRKRWSMPHPALLERVVFLPRLSPNRFMMLISHMDVLLDTPHFGSGNTMYESMAYGIPIITWPGDFMRGRLVSGIYTWLGITDAPIAATLDDYAPLAVSFATDRDRCDTLKQQLIAKSSALYQDELAVRELEAFFEQAVAASRRGEKLSRWLSCIPSPTQETSLAENLYRDSHTGNRRQNTP